MLFSVLLDFQKRGVRSVAGHAILRPVACKKNGRLQPEFAISVRRPDVDMRRLASLVGVEVKTERSDARTVGIPPAREAGLAGGMPEVPKGQGLARLARHFILAGVTSSVSDACCLASRQQQKCNLRILCRSPNREIVAAVSSEHPGKRLARVLVRVRSAASKYRRFV